MTDNKSLSHSAVPSLQSHSNSNGNGAWPPECPSSRDTSPILHGNPNSAPTVGYNVITKLLGLCTGAGPIHILLLQDDRDFRVRGRLGKKGGGPGKGDVVGNSGAGASSVGALEGVLIDVAGCGGVGGKSKEWEKKSGEERAMHNCSSESLEGF